MRNIQKLIVFILLTFVFSCSNDDVLQDINNEEATILNKGNGANGSNNNLQNNALQYSQSKLIIEYHIGTSPAAKAGLRQQHGVVSFEICKHCPDETIEMWNFGGPINIEPKRGVIISPPSGGGNGGLYPIKEVDYEFNLELSSSTTTKLNSSIYETMFTTPYLKTSNDGITIAVIDTGIDTSQPVFTDNFLYNAEHISPEDDTISGWDFVNNVNDPYDDNPGKHGTVVSSIIYDEFKLRSSAPFQIMPIKAFKADGTASYFNVLCATNLALDYADMINMSFGWKDDAFGDFQNTILSSLIASKPDVIVVASAGNYSNNNDGIDQAHYPSNYPQPNMYAIGATNQGDSNVAGYSNFGATSVDFYASGKTTFLDNEAQGTSFAAPVVTAAIANILSEATTDTATSIGYIVPQLILIGENCTGLGFNDDKPVLYDTFIEALE